MTNTTMKNTPDQFPIPLALLCITIALSFLPSTTRAQTTAFSYQGSLTDAGAPADGSYDFQFTLKDALSGGSTVGSTVAHDGVSVTGGVFTVSLDFGIAAFDGTGRWLEIAVRPDSGGSFTTLAPRQPVHPAPYSLLAQRLPNVFTGSGRVGIGTSDPSTRLHVDGTVTAGGFSGPLDGTSLTAGSVGSDALANGAVSISKLAPTYLPSPPDAVRGLTLTGGQADLDVTFDASFGPGTTPEVTLPPGWTLTGTPSADGFTATASFQPVTVDDSEDVGTFASLALYDGRPAISYFNRTSGDLMYVTADDAEGTGWGIPQTVESEGVVGNFSSQAIYDNTTSIIAYRSSIESKLAVSVSEDGTNWIPVPVEFGISPIDTSIAWTGPRPAISYVVGDPGSLKFATSTNISTWDRHDVDTTTSVKGGTSLVEVGGHPAISYRDSVNNHLLYVRANDPLGSSWGTPVIVNNGTGGGESSMAIVDGHPAISFRHSTNLDLYYVRANDPVGASWPPPMLVDGAGVAGRYSSLAVVAGRPVISYTGTGGLRLAVATDAVGSAWGNVRVDAGNMTDTSLIDLNGRAAIAYRDDNANTLKFAHLPAFPTWTADSGNVHPVFAARSTHATQATRADSVIDGAVTTASITDGTITASDLHPSLGLWSTSGQNVYRQDGSVGIGTDSPIRRLHIHGSTAEMAFTQTSSVNEGWHIGSISDRFQIVETNDAARMTFSPGGNVGIGTSNPTHTLTVHTPDRYSIMNTNDAGVKLATYLGSESAQIGSTSNHKFELFAADDVHATITPGGNVGIGNRDPDEKLTVNGNLKCTTAIITSDRDKKDGFTHVDPREVLDKVAAMPITRWHYKSDTGTPHIGPVAQDFHAAFGLGTDDKHIATVDADGVALAAIQGMKQLIDEKDARISSLEQRLKEIEFMLQD